MPERLSIPGFLRARRFLALSGGPEFYTLYEADTPETISGKEYLERLNTPTEWTRRIMPVFRNMARSVCRVAYSRGVGDGGFMFTGRFGFPPGQESAVVVELQERILPPLCDLPGIVGVHLCLADEQASTIPTFEKTFRASADLVSAGVVMMEGSSIADINTATRALERQLIPRLNGQRIDGAIYQLEHAHTNGATGGPHRTPK
ncbi:MAG: hypothetical protein JO099_08275 [Acidobacteriia bacterium]|nr:hypothetical protein [Terriglobia bacterium]